MQLLHKEQNQHQDQDSNIHVHSNQILSTGRSPVVQQIKCWSVTLVVLGSRPAEGGYILPTVNRVSLHTAFHFPFVLI